MKYYDLDKMKYNKDNFLMGFPVVVEGEIAPDPLPNYIGLCFFCDNMFDRRIEGSYKEFIYISSFDTEHNVHGCKECCSNKIQLLRFLH